MHTYIHTCIHAYMHTYMHTCIHAYKHTYIHTYIHTIAYIHTLNHITLPLPLPLPLHYITVIQIHTYIHTYIHTTRLHHISHIQYLRWFPWLSNNQNIMTRGVRSCDALPDPYPNQTTWLADEKTCSDKLKVLGCHIIYVVVYTSIMEHEPHNDTSLSTGSSSKNGTTWLCR